MPTTNGCLTDFAEQKLLDHLVNNTSWTMPTCYFALWSANPTDAASGGAEVATPGSDGYARIAVGTAGSSKFGAAASHAISTASTVSFGAATAAWTTPAYWALMDASTGGNMLAYGAITGGSIGNGDRYDFTSGQISLAFSGTMRWTDTVLNSLLEHLVGKTSYTSPAVWLALFNGDPMASGTEVTTAGSNGYARQDLDAALSAASGGSITNGSVITYGPGSGSNWAAADYFAVYDASTAGTKLGGAPLGASKTVNIGESAEFAASALTFTLD